MRREVAELPKVEHFLRSGEWPEEDWEKLPEPERAALAAFMGWWNENMLIAGAMTDLHAAHLDYKYGATVDFLLVDRAGDLHAIFRDTGMDIEKELLRMGAAVGALVSIRGLRVKAASLLRPGRPLTLKLEQLRQCYTIFTYCVDVSQGLHKVRKMASRQG